MSDGKTRVGLVVQREVVMSEARRRKRAVFWRAASGVVGFCVVRKVLSHVEFGWRDLVCVMWVVRLVRRVAGGWEDIVEGIGGFAREVCCNGGGDVGLRWNHCFEVCCHVNNKVCTVGEFNMAAGVPAPPITLNQPCVPCCRQTFNFCTLIQLLSL